jgi:hypothetical protein
VSLLPRHLLGASLAGLLLALGACSGLKDVGEGPLTLSDSEKERVRARVDRDLADAKGRKDWAAAWNQEVGAGSDRDRLEGFALGALEAADGDAEDMFAALRKKWGPLGAASRRRVEALVEDAIAKKDWERALEIEILTADDPPTYARAFALYERCPAREAEDLLEAIDEARKDFAEGGG